jgi:hypothetical protein
MDEEEKMDEALMQPMRTGAAVRALLFPIVYGALCVVMVLGTAAREHL